MALREPPVHLEQLPRPQGGLLAACAGADLHDQVLAVVGVLRHQELFQLRPQRRRPAPRPAAASSSRKASISGSASARGQSRASAACCLAARYSRYGRDDLLQLGEAMPSDAQSLGVGERPRAAAISAATCLVAGLDLARVVRRNRRHGPIIPARRRDRPRDVPVAGRQVGGVGAVLVEVELDRREVGDVDRGVVVLVAAGRTAGRGRPRARSASALVARDPEVLVARVDELVVGRRAGDGLRPQRSRSASAMCSMDASTSSASASHGTGSARHRPGSSPARATRRRPRGPWPPTAAATASPAAGRRAGRDGLARPARMRSASSRALSRRSCPAGDPAPRGSARRSDPVGLGLGFDPRGRPRSWLRRRCGSASRSAVASSPANRFEMRS